MHLEALIPLVLKISILLSVLALGLRATFADATFLFRQPRELGRAFLSMNVLMPLVALILVMLFDLNPAVKIALVALSVSPVPPTFPKQALKARCKEDYAIGLLVGAAVLSIVVIPATMKIFQRIGGVPLQMPARSVAVLALETILAPLLVGIWVRKLAPVLAERAARPVGVLASVLLILGLLPVVFGSTRTILSLVGNGTLLSMTVFALVGFAAGRLLGGPESENGRTLALATACRHPGVAVAIAHANFPQQKLAVPAVALYVVVSGILWAITSRIHSREGTGPTEVRKRVAV